MSPVNHYGFYQGWKRSLIHLSVTLHTSHLPSSFFFSLKHSYNISRFLLSVSTAQIKVLITNTRKQQQITTLSLISSHTSISTSFIAHIKFSQEVTNCFRDYIKKKWIQSSLKTFPSSTKSSHSIKICFIVITVLHVTQTGVSSFSQNKRMCLTLIGGPIWNLFKCLLSTYYNSFAD